MPLVVDLTGVSLEGPPPLEPDVYRAVITKADIHPSKSSGHDTLYLDLAVGDEGRTMRWNCPADPSDPKNMWRFKRLLVRLGWELPEGEMEFDEADLVGQECQVRTILEPHYRDPDRKTARIAEVMGAEEDGTASWG
jgi:hypothetical protein